MFMIPVYLVDQFQHAYPCSKALPRSDPTFLSSLGPLCVSSHTTIWVTLSFRHLSTHPAFVAVVQLPSCVWLFTTPWLCSTLGFLIPHQFLEFAQVRVHCIGDSIQLSHRLSPSFPFVFNLSQHQGLFQRAGWRRERQTTPAYLLWEPQELHKEALALFYLMNFPYILTVPELSHTHTHTHHFLPGHFLSSNQLKGWAGTSLVAQWLRIHLPMQGMQVQSLIAVVQLLSYVWLFGEPMDCSPPGSFVCGISQARILESVAISSSRGSSRYLTPHLLHWSQILYCCATRGSPSIPGKGGKIPHAVKQLSHNYWSYAFWSLCPTTREAWELQKS